MILLVDSLTRLAEAYGDADAAKEFFDAGRAQGADGRRESHASSAADQERRRT